MQIMYYDTEQKFNVRWKAGRWSANHV